MPVGKNFSGVLFNALLKGLIFHVNRQEKLVK
jgi:hypothetical protein